MNRTPPVSAAYLGVVLGHIYEAALDYEKWRSALGEIKTALRANNVILIFRTGAQYMPGLSLIYRDDLYEYADLMASAAYPTPLDAVPPEQVATIADLLSDAQWRNSALFRKLCEPADVFDILFVDLRLRDGSACRVRITRPESASRFDQGDKEFLALLVPHLKRAVETQSMLEQGELVRYQYVEACDRMGIATFILDAKSNVLQYNKSAHTLIGSDDGLKLADGRLEASHSGSNTELRRLIKEALGRCESIAEPVISDVMPVIRPSKKANFGLFLQSLPATKLHSGRSGPALTVFVRDPEFRAQAPVAIVQRLYRLTQAEAALVFELVNGQTLDEASAKLHISRNTARAQLRAIFAKTGVQRQTTLVRIILNSIVPPGDGAQLVAATAPGRYGGAPLGNAQRLRAVRSR